MSTHGSTTIAGTFEDYLRDKGKGRTGSTGNFRSEAERELHRFESWITETLEGPTLDDLDESIFRQYARHLVGDRDLAANTVQTYYAYISSWVGWCVKEGHIDTHYANSPTAREPLPEDDGRRPGDQQAWTPTQRDEITAHVDELVEKALPLPDQKTDDSTRERARYTLIKALRDRTLVYVLAYTGIRVGEVFRDPNDAREERDGLRWEYVDLEDHSMTIYRKNQAWKEASIPDPVRFALDQYRRALDPPDSWPIFPTFHNPSISSAIERATKKGRVSDTAVQTARDTSTRDFWVALDLNIDIPALTTEGARGRMKALSDSAGLDLDGSNHDYLAPHGGRRGMGETLVREGGYTAAARYLDNSEEMIRERYQHIEAGERADMATMALAATDKRVSETEETHN